LRRLKNVGILRGKVTTGGPAGGGERESKPKRGHHQQPESTLREHHKFHSFRGLKRERHITYVVDDTPPAVDCQYGPLQELILPRPAGEVFRACGVNCAGSEYLTCGLEVFSAANFFPIFSNRGICRIRLRVRPFLFRRHPL
jgi:hypothetical protein